MSEHSIQTVYGASASDSTERFHRRRREEGEGTSTSTAPRVVPAAASLDSHLSASITGRPTSTGGITSASASANIRGKMEHGSSGGPGRADGRGRRGGGRVAFLDLPTPSESGSDRALLAGAADSSSASVVSGRTVVSTGLESTASAASIASADSQMTAKVSNTSRRRGAGNNARTSHANATPVASHPARTRPAFSASSVSEVGYVSSAGTGLVVPSSAVPEAKVVAEVMAELEAELDAEEEQEQEREQKQEKEHVERGGIKSQRKKKGGGGRRRGDDRDVVGRHGEGEKNRHRERGKRSSKTNLPVVSEQALHAEDALGSHAHGAKGRESVSTLQNQQTRTGKRATRRKSSMSASSQNSCDGEDLPTTRTERLHSSASSTISHDGERRRGSGRDKNGSLSTEDNRLHGPSSSRPNQNETMNKDVEAAEALFKMAQMEMESGNFEAAKRNLEQALTLTMNQNTMDHPMVGNINHSLGLLQIKYGKYETACMTLWEAQRIRKLNMDLVGAADSLQEIGKVHRQEGRTELALDCYGECLRVRRAELGDDNLKVADAYVDLGNIESDLGRKRDACEHYKNALTIMKLNSMNKRENTDSSIHKNISHLLQKMANWELSLGDSDHALAHFQEFVETRRVQNLTADTIYVEALLNVAKISMEHGDDATAYDASVEAVEVFEENRLGYHNARLGREARETVRELAGGSSQSIFKRFGAGLESLADEVE